jgi:hypothetical protein
VRIYLLLLTFASVLLSLGAQTGNTWQTINLASPSNAQSLANYVDIDGDGLLDVVGSQFTFVEFEHQPFWMKKLVDGTFSLPIYLPSIQPFSVVKGVDWDNDGDNDIISFSNDRDNGYFRWFENLGGHPIKWKLNTVELPGNVHPERFILDDLNSDGTIDIVVLTAIDDQKAFAVWLSDGNGGLGNPYITPTEEVPYLVSQLRLFDVDNDGLKDIVISSVLTGGSNATYTAGWYRLLRPDAPTLSAYKHIKNLDHRLEFDMADLNQDGQLDLLSATEEGRTLINLSTVNGYTDTLFLPDVRMPVEAIDVNADGLKDLFLPDENGVLGVRLAQPVLSFGELEGIKPIIRFAPVPYQSANKRRCRRSVLK